MPIIVPENQDSYSHNIPEIVMAAESISDNGSHKGKGVIINDESRTTKDSIGYDSSDANQVSILKVDDLHNDSIDQDILDEYRYSLRRQIKAIAKVKSLTQSEEKRIEKIEQDMFAAETAAFTGEPARFHPDFVQEILKWARKKNEKKSILSVSNILNTLEKEKTWSNWLKAWNSGKYEDKRAWFLRRNDPHAYEIPE